MRRPVHWQDPANAVVAVALLVSPWTLDYALVQPALANAVIVGTLLFTVSVAASVLDRAWVEWACVGLGGWMLAAPWTLGFTEPRATWAALVTGSMALLLGCAVLVARWWHGRAASSRSLG